jgi:hypothetical protein
MYVANISKDNIQNKQKNKDVQGQYEVAGMPFICNDL